MKNEIECTPSGWLQKVLYGIGSNGMGGKLMDMQSAQRLEVYRQVSPLVKYLLLLTWH